MSQTQPGISWQPPALIKYQSGQRIKGLCNTEKTHSLHTEVLALCTCGSSFHTFGPDPVHCSEAALVLNKGHLSCSSVSEILKISVSKNINLERKMVFRHNSVFDTLLICFSRILTYHMAQV